MKKCSSEFCDEEATGTYKGKLVCEECMDGYWEMEANNQGPDPHGDRDPTPEEQAGWAFDDKLAMYRNEY